MESLDDLQRAFLDGIYTWRIPIAVGSMLAAVVILAMAWRAGWFASARRHPGRAVLLLAIVLVAGIPLGYYLASPIWIRTELIEPEPVAVAVVVPSSPPGGSPAGASSASGGPSVSAAPTAAPSSPDSASTDPPSFAPRTVAMGRFAGTDDFHFGRGTARIIETSPGRYTLRLAEFSVRNGPDLYVYLSPEANDYARGALELGKLKATDGAFGYDLPAGTDPADFASAIIWCKQFAHLFATAPLAAT
ncbi:MAG: DM13 domain-containing protein [Chloroflexota bacterium]